LAQPLPAKQLLTLERIPGIGRYAVSFFGGSSGKKVTSFAQFAVDPVRFRGSSSKADR